MMRTWMYGLSMAMVLTASTGTAWAHGDWTCKTYPKEQWRPHTELQRKLETDGWRLRQMKTSNGCYEVYGVDPKGKRVEAFFDPKTFERIDTAEE
jgi:hypothetical protein